LHVFAREELEHRQVLQVPGLQNLADPDGQQKSESGLLSGICEPEKGFFSVFSKVAMMLVWETCFLSQAYRNS